MRTGKIPASISALSNRVPELAARLENWANINSGSSHAAGLERMRLALRQSFAALPGSLLDEPPLPDSALRALRVRLRPDAPRRILLSGHYDTVYDAGHPFQACRWENERILRGPGVADMKGGIVVMHAALEAFEQSPGADRLGWEVLLTPDEETGSRGSAPLLAEAAQRNDFGLVFEPARPDGNLVRSRKGVGQLSVICRGRAAHVAREPNDGRNAIVALAEFLCAASRVPGKLPGALVNAGRIRGGSDATNIVPDFAEAVLDVRATRAADQTLLLVADSASQFVYSYQIQPDGSLANKQSFYHLHLVEGAAESAADGIAVDRNGTLYVTSRIGLQVADQAGKVNSIINKPQPGPLSNVVFGGPNFDELFVTIGDKVYKRKVRTQGVLNFADPITPAPPRL